MKEKPEIILNNNDKILYEKILVTGSDETFMSYVRSHIIKTFRNNKYFIDNSGNYNKKMVGDLFSDKKILFLLKEFSSKKESVKTTKPFDQSLLITCPNGKRINLIKNEFSKSSDCLVIECYPLNRKSKELALKQYIDRNGINISSDIFWYIVESFDNQYVFFIQQLDTLNLLKNKASSIKVIERAVFVDTKIDLSKIFFCIFKNNKYLINIFNKNIYSQTDFYIFLNSLKLYLEIIASSNSKEVALSKFPRYLFGEKDVFTKIYNQLNKSKVLKIYENISKVEGLVRKNSGLYNIIGLRFLLNTKKIITS